MAGFAAAALIALFCVMFVTAEDWWPMGRRILARLALLLASAAALGAAQYL
jgi:hypothetical protein